MSAPKRGLQAGPTYEKNLPSPRRLRMIGRASRAVERLKLGRTIIRAVNRGRVLWAPTGRTRAWAGYSPTERDVIVCTYAKSGTNLLLHMVHRIGHHGAGDFEHIHDVVAWPEAPHPTGAALNDPPDVGSPTGLRAVKTHLAARWVPYSANARYVHVVRDPLDTLVSAYHFAHSVIGAMIDAKLSPEEWVELCLRDRLFFGSWAEHTASWWSLRERDNVLLLSFEEMLRAPAEGVWRVAEFLGVALSQEQHARIVELCSYRWMKEHDFAFAPPFATLPGRTAPCMVRRGVVGDSVNLLTPGDRARLDAFFRAELRRLGSSFPYAQLLAREPIAQWVPAKLA